MQLVPDYRPADDGADARRHKRLAEYDATIATWDRQAKHAADMARRSRVNKASFLESLSPG